MLVRDDGASWTAITQPAHALLAAQVAAAWDPAPAPEVVLGAQQHDVAWTAWDREPPLHADAGRACAFYEAPAGPRLAIWEDVTAEVDAQSPYAAALVAQHAINIHTRYAPPGSVPEGFVEAHVAARDALLAVLPDADAARCEADGELVFAVDALSLTLCFGWDARDLPPVAGTTVHVAPRGTGVWVLDPWPLRVEVLEVVVRTRTLTERFADEAAMQQALAATPRQEERLRLEPA